VAFFKSPNSLNNSWKLKKRKTYFSSKHWWKTQTNNGGERSKLYLLYRAFNHLTKSLLSVSLQKRPNLVLNVTFLVTEHLTFETGYMAFGLQWNAHCCSFIKLGLPVATINIFNKFNSLENKHVKQTHFWLTEIDRLSQMFNKKTWHVW